MATTIHNTRPISRRKKFFFSLIIGSVFLILILSLIEIILRKRVGPWVIHPPETLLTIEPAGRYFARHPTLGYLPKPGASKVTLPGPYSFRITHLPNGLRITHPLDTYPARKKKEMWIFGCSFTEGWSLNDEETYPWLLQEKFGNYEVVNFGVSAYSTVQSLIQFREALEKGEKPDLAILSYASFHDQRNTLTRAWTKQKMTYGAAHYIGRVDLPYMKWSKDKNSDILYQPLEYHAVPLARYSALANFLDESYNRSLESTYHSHEISKALIEEFSNLCKENRINLVVAGIFSDPTTSEMLEYCKAKGIITVDIAVDLGIKENTNFPYDNHPSAIANQQYAQKLGSFLCSNLMSNEPPCTSR